MSLMVELGYEWNGVLRVRQMFKTRSRDGNAVGVSTGRRWASSPRQKSDTVWYDSTDECRCQHPARMRTRGNVVYW